MNTHNKLIELILSCVTYTMFELIVCLNVCAGAGTGAICLYSYIVIFGWRKTDCRIFNKCTVYTVHSLSLSPYNPTMIASMCRCGVRMNTFYVSIKLSALIDFVFKYSSTLCLPPTYIHIAK